MPGMNHPQLGADVTIGIGVVILLFVLILWHSGSAPQGLGPRASFSGKPRDPNWADYQSFYMPYFDNYYGAYYDPYYGPDNGWRGPSLGPAANYGLPPKRAPPPAATCNSLCENGVPC